MARTLIQEIAHQIFYTPPKHKRSDNHSGSKHSRRDYSFEKRLYQIKQQAFENKKIFEILKLKNKGKGLI